MTPEINEWEFTGDVQKWITEILVKNFRLPFSEAKIEQRVSGSTKRRDFTLLDKDKRAVLTGEVKMPWANDGGSPYNNAVVQDARQKARIARARFFFTWNVNEFVLWETESAEAPLRDRKYNSWPVTLVHKPGHLEASSTIQAIKTWLEFFLSEFARIYHGEALLGTQLPDEKFLRMLEVALHQPIFYTQDELEKCYGQPKLKRNLDQWMRDKGWLIVDDPEGVRDNLERAAKYACYALVNKIVFHEALLKRYAGMMEKLSVDNNIKTGDDLYPRLEKYFLQAKEVTKDYETVFGEEHTGIGNRIPFYSDHAVPYWRDLINQIHDFDFSQIDYEVIGNIFERLLSPSERKKYGQFYTRVEVVDLINSFCITRGLEKVIDPACGGGTFLVRAYARKRILAPGRKHGELLSDLFGVDVDEFAAHLTTINLASRDLIDAENYPQIVRSDFFDLKADKAFMSLPIHSKGLGKIQRRKVEIPRLDAVIGNPPYVEQEDIRKAKNRKNPERGTKEYYRNLVQDEMQATLSGRSDIHCYFWPHAAGFLKEDGYLCFLTSSQWLDTDYGFRLQGWVLRHFEIVAVFESIDEPWFEGARVTTAVTILRRQSDERRRMGNIVRFVQLRRPIREILSHDVMEGGAFEAADDFRNEILALQASTVNKRYRARLVRQGNLWQDGVRLGMAMGRSLSIPRSDDPEVQDGDYYGGKWGIYLRAPNLWFNLIDELGENLVPLGNIADIWRGITSGKDNYFFPINCSDACLAAHSDMMDFELNYGVPREFVASGQIKLVRCGEGREEIRPIEAEYLEPELHNLMEIDGFTVSPEDCSRQILLVGEKPGEIKDKYVLSYIKWGEKHGINAGSTCNARATANRGWYDLTGHKRGAFFWSMSQQYKHAIPANDHNLICNHNLFDISPKGGNAATLGGILNSSLVVLSKFLYGRPAGVEGLLKTEVVDVNMMLVPNPLKGAKPTLQRVAQAFENLKQRKVLYFLSVRRLKEMDYRNKGKEAKLDKLSDLCELDMADRRELDDAVLEMLGIEPASRREELLGELYECLRELFELIRQKEEKGIINKNKARRRGQASPTEIAAQILAEIQENHPDLLSRYDPDFLSLTKPFDTFDLPGEGIPQALKDTNPLLYDRGVVFLKGKKPLAHLITKIPEQDPLIILLACSGLHGLVRLPHDPEECDRLYQEYAAFLRRKEETVRELIGDRTRDEDIQEKIYAALMPRLLWGK